jgi:hypothetical protein
MKTSKKDRRIAAVNAASRRSNVEAAAAADRHARDFSTLFSISSPVSVLDGDLNSYLSDAALAAERN